jgi:urease accessory protein
MYAVISPSESRSGNAELVAPHRWSDGAAEVSFAWTDDETRLRHLYQSDPCRVLFPRQADGAPKEAVIVTTSGGIVGGDRLRFEIEAGPGCAAVVTTQAAEKIYRSTGADAEINVSVRTHDRALLEWMPQETILYEGARLRRRTQIDLQGSARMLAGEIVVFGRRARGEIFTHGLLHDDWRIFRDGRLVWADGLHLAGDIGPAIANPHAFAGAAAVGTVIYGGLDAADRLEIARAYAGTGCASCIGGLLVVKFVDTDAAALRAEFTSFWKQFRHAVTGLPTALPRVWEV